MIHNNVSAAKYTYIYTVCITHRRTHNNNTDVHVVAAWNDAKAMQKFEFMCTHIRTHGMFINRKSSTMFISMMFPLLCLCQYVYLNFPIPHHVCTIQCSRKDLFYPSCSMIITPFVLRFDHFIEISYWIAIQFVLQTVHTVHTTIHLPTGCTMYNKCSYQQCWFNTTEIDSQFSAVSKLFCNKFTTNPPTMHAVRSSLIIRWRFVQ